MKSVLLGLLAETPVHPGAGRSLGVVDLPVAREAATDYPVLVGSSLKGALRDRAETDAPGDAGFAERWFGAGPDADSDRRGAGQLLVSDGRLLLLPVRSLTGASRWVTCPQLLERLQRDLARTGHLSGGSPLPGPGEGKALWSRPGDQKEIHLEERRFTPGGEPPGEAVEAVASLVPHEAVRQRLQERLVIVSDDDFGWFARYGLPVTARNHLKNESKISDNLWYEETLPPDTLMYAVLATRNADDPPVTQIFPEEQRYLQVGGNETVGQGWFAVCRREPEGVATR